MLTKNFDHRVPEIRSHDATEIRPRYVLRPARNHAFGVHARAVSSQALTGRAQRNPIFLAISDWFQQHKRRLTVRITLYQQNWNSIKNAIQKHIKLLLIQAITYVRNA